MQKQQQRRNQNQIKARERAQAAEVAAAWQKAGRATAKLVRGKIETAKQRALRIRQEKFSRAKDIYATANFIAVVDRGGTSYYKKNDENRAIARVVLGGQIRIGKTGNKRVKI